jgi:hypothetical protein
MLRDQIQKQAVEALKSGESTKANALRFLVSLIDKRALQLPPGEMSETEEIQVLRKELKNKEEAKAMFAQGGREDLVAEQEAEIQLVKVFLPQEMSEDQIREIVKKVVTDKGNNFGMVMGETMKLVAGQAGGELVSKIVREELSQ